MDVHQGVTCDICGAQNFGGRRFKCLICADYDLCGDCKDKDAVSHNHLKEHAMQCILTRAAQEIFFGNDDSPPNAVHECWTCPYCANMGYTTRLLIEHVHELHPASNRMVLCPICVSTGSIVSSLPFHTDLLTHLIQIHAEKRRSSNRDAPQVRDSSTAAGGSSSSRLGLTPLRRVHFAPSSLPSSMSSTYSSRSSISTQQSSNLSAFTRALSEIQQDSANSLQESYYARLEQLEMEWTRRLTNHRESRRSDRNIVAQETRRAAARNSRYPVSTPWPRLPATAIDDVEMEPYEWYSAPLAQQLRVLMPDNLNLTNDSLNMSAFNTVAAGASMDITDSGDVVKEKEKPDPNENFLLKKFLSPPQLSEEEQAEKEIEQADRSEFVEQLLMSLLSITEATGSEKKEEEHDKIETGDLKDVVKQVFEKLVAGRKGEPNKDSNAEPEDVEMKQVDAASVLCEDVVDENTADN